MFLSLPEARQALELPSNSPNISFIIESSVICDHNRIMRIAITGGTGFVGRHLAERLLLDGHEVVLVARGVDQRESVVSGAEMIEGSVGDQGTLLRAFEGCDAVAHCAGINREVGSQTYQAIHVEGTRNVVRAAKEAGVERIAFLSFLRARPDCGSGYHESKFAGEEIVRGSGIDYTVIKAGVIYGKGDHFLDHVSHALHTFPIFLKVGLREQPCAPLAIEDLTQILTAAMVAGRLKNETLGVMGPETMVLSEGVRRIARVVGKRPLFLPCPIWIHYLMAKVFEHTMAVPLESSAQVRILSESLVDAAGSFVPLPADLIPITRLTDDQIRKGLPKKGAVSGRDCLRRVRVR